ncbi:MAG TPA: protease pro-enzyme activation domain-containing protein, partial [Verrucomicrobiae bacterium]|nr:protease pro-enzyme activation domain-containing protein [Verrucomicrobiae bacterium]
MKIKQWHKLCGFFRMNLSLRSSYKHFIFAAGMSFGLASAGVFSATAAGAGRQMLPSHVPAVVASLRPVNSLPATNQLYLTIGLPLRNQPELDELLRQLYDPASPDFRKYLTPQEFTARFGPSESDYAALLDFVRTNGFQIVGTHPNRVLVDVVGTAATVERVFAITLRTYRHPNESRDFFAPDTEPSVAAPVTVLNVSGLNNFSLPHPNFKPRPLTTQSAATPFVGSGPGGSYRGNDFRAAYVPGTPLTGAGQSVGLLQFDGYHSNDIAAYISQAGITTSVVLTNVLINGGVPTPGSGEVEVCLDIEMAISMAPGLDKIIVYEGPNGGTAWSTILSRMANDNLAKQLSCSWGGGSPDATSEQIFKQMAAQGQSFFNATGDSDAFTGSIAFPSDSTNITQVGGTTLSMTGAGGSYVSETTWNWGGGTGSSGGVSTYYKIPSWQTNISMAANGGSTTYRNVPDVSLTGDNIYVTFGNGSSQTVGGTSCAAPLWSGYCALINQQAVLAAKPPVGFLNPTLYAMANTASYNSNFHDIATGDNTSPSSLSQYYAVAGYDLCTGLGTPNGTNLINALAPLVFAPSIAGGSWTLLTESASPTNGAIDPGETVSVSFALQNSGNQATTSLIAILQTNAGVLAPGGSQSYGTLAAFGGAASGTFTFTAAGTCGSNIIAALKLQDGTNNLGAVNFTLPLGKGFGLSQKFDGVTAPNLPVGWATATVSGTAANWVVSAALSDTAPNSAFIADAAAAGQNALVSPAIPISGTNAQLAFSHNYNLEFAGNGGNRTYYDGGVLEIQIGGGSFTDILTAGGSFITGGYNRAITTSSDNPLGGRSAWAGSSGGWKSVTVKLPASAAGQNIRLRWNCATDNGNSGGNVIGWYVDTVSITDTAASCLTVL